MAKVDVLSMFPEELEAFALEIGEKKFRGKQIFEGLYRGAREFSQITNLPKSLIARLEETAEIPAMTTERMLVSKLDGTVKFLFGLQDGEAVESVFMRYKHGNTLCISTQVGCRMGCAFCASTKAGLKRSLRPSEMLLQILCAQRETGEEVSNVVLMGMGEPLDNYDNVLKFLRLVNLEKGLNIGMRHISLSTCGLVDRMDDLAKENLQITLSVSLHAATDEKRKEIMPIARKYSVDELMAACDRYTKATGRRISYEYALIAGVNDTPEDAHLLGKLLKGRLAHLNLIPVNPIKERDFQKSGKEAIAAFTEITENKYKVSTTVRRKLGGDIDASCGQLRAQRDGL
ncbi:MAG: 23S rRNA (adenine(2503)-C(2))-methyltransferase RlmN [Ruminococcaceae bacterium]|nr:23S rRNA (adenine(2503)-C(2))-methyltransferase RlmN [Oscillospiraceae bacterium]MBQ8323673.1 23S rRNA (adenine(2503)-C(2))-methyltransferase RlmN [Clostridia bacterium]